MRNRFVISILIVLTLLLCKTDSVSASTPIKPIGIQITLGSIYTKASIPYKQLRVIDEDNKLVVYLHEFKNSANGKILIGTAKDSGLILFIIFRPISLSADELVNHFGDEYQPTASGIVYSKLGISASINRQGQVTELAKFLPLKDI